VVSADTAVLVRLLLLFFASVTWVTA
jgi:hypothetical protein